MWQHQDLMKVDLMNCKTVKKKVSKNLKLNKSTQKKVFGENAPSFDIELRTSKRCNQLKFS